MLLLQICFYFVMREISDFMKSLSRESQAYIIEVFISRYLDDLLNINNVHVEQMVDRICLAEFELNRANSSDTEARF